jgi:predicted PurR-regulated permease PerM
MKDNIRIPLIILSVIILGGILWYFKSIVAYILISAVISLIGRPFVSFLNKIKIGKFHFSRAFVAGITLILFWSIIFCFFRIFLPLIANQAKEISSLNVQEITKNFEKPIKNAETFISRYHLVKDKNNLEEFISDKIESMLNIADVYSVFGTIFNMLGNIFVAFFAISFITFFFLKQDEMFHDSIILLVPTKYEIACSNALNSINHLLMRYFVGISIDVICIIILNTCGLLIVGVGFEHALVIGLVTGFLNIIPYVGPLIGIIFGLSVGVVTNATMGFNTELLYILGSMFLVFVIVQIIDATVIQPTIFSNSVKAHPLEIFLVIMMAGSLAGVLGMVLAIPTYTIIRVIAKQFFNEIKVVKKLTKNL